MVIFKSNVMRLLVPLIVLLVTTTLATHLPDREYAATGLQQATAAEGAKTPYQGKSGIHADTEAAFESSGLLNRLEPFEF